MRGTPLPSRGGFSIVELMLSIAIVGVLVAIAAPWWQRAQYEARQTEIDTNLRSIYDTISVRHAADGTPLYGAPNPSPETIGREPRKWNSGLDAAQQWGWSELGWAPDGDVRCSYEFADYGYSEAWYASASCDIDGDLDLYIVHWLGPFYQPDYGKVYVSTPHEY